MCLQEEKAKHTRTCSCACSLFWHQHNAGLNRPGLHRHYSEATLANSSNGLIVKEHRSAFIRRASSSSSSTSRTYASRVIPTATRIRAHHISHAHHSACAPRAWRAGGSMLGLHDVCSPCHRGTRTNHHQRCLRVSGGEYPLIHPWQGQHAASIRVSICQHLAEALRVRYRVPCNDAPALLLIVQSSTITVPIEHSAQTLPPQRTMQ